MHSPFMTNILALDSTKFPFTATNHLLRHKASYGVPAFHGKDLPFMAYLWPQMAQDKKILTALIIAKDDFVVGCTPKISTEMMKDNNNPILARICILPK